MSKLNPKKHPILRSPKLLNTKHRHSQKQPNKQQKPNNDDDNNYTRHTILKIYNILRHTTWDTAKNQLNNLPIKWDSFTVNQILKTHPPMQKSWLFFNWAATSLRGFKHDHYTYTTMLDIFGEAGRIESMFYVFDRMRDSGVKVDGVCYTVMMHWLGKYGRVEEAVELWGVMKREGFKLGVVSYTAYLKILLGIGRVDEAGEVYREMIANGCVPSCLTYTVLMEYLVGAGKCKEALEMFYNMQEAGVKPDKAACNILVEKCSKVGDMRTMMRILEYMNDNRLVLRYAVYMEALKSLEAAGESNILLRQVNPHITLESCSMEDTNRINPHITPESCSLDEAGESGAGDAGYSLDEGLILVLLRKQNLAIVDHLISGLMEKNIQLDPKIIMTVIEVNCGLGRTDGAILAFEYSLKMGIRFVRSTYLALVGTMIRSNTFAKVVEIVEEMDKAGHSLGTYLGALLIYKLGIARRPTFAAKVFCLLPHDQKNTATYTAMISVYFSAGSADKALKIYKMMQKKGINPCLGTYNVLFTGLEKSGRTSEADTYRKERKMLQSHCQDLRVGMDQRIVNLLFAGDMVST